MKIVPFILFFLTMLTTYSQPIDPYQVLQIHEGATEDEIRQQFKKLKKNAKNDKQKIELYQQVYQQIMLDSTLKMTLPNQGKKISSSKKRRNKRRRRGLPRLSDMFRSDYFVPQQNQPQKSASQRSFQMQDQKNFAQQLKQQRSNSLPAEQSDHLYQPKNFNRNQTVLDEKVNFNIKAARFILFLGGILLKLSPCFCLFMIYKFRKLDLREVQQNNPFVKALNGWTGKNRRTIKKNK